jgi:hypothetical protein
VSDAYRIRRGRDDARPRAADDFRSWLSAIPPRIAAPPTTSAQLIDSPRNANASSAVTSGERYWNVVARSAGIRLIAWLKSAKFTAVQPTPMKSRSARFPV